MLILLCSCVGSFCMYEFGVLAAVCRKRDFPSPSAVYSRKLKGTALVRKSSLGGTRPFLNQYEVKGQSIEL